MVGTGNTSPRIAWRNASIRYSMRPTMVPCRLPTGWKLSTARAIRPTVAPAFMATDNSGCSPRSKARAKSRNSASSVSIPSKSIASASRDASSDSSNCSRWLRRQQQARAHQRHQAFDLAQQLDGELAQQRDALLVDAHDLAEIAELPLDIGEQPGGFLPKAGAHGRASTSRSGARR